MRATTCAARLWRWACQHPRLTATLTCARFRACQHPRLPAGSLTHAKFRACSKLEGTPWEVAGAFERQGQPKTASPSANLFLPFHPQSPEELRRSLDELQAAVSAEREAAAAAERRCRELAAREETIAKVCRGGSAVRCPFKNRCGANLLDGS